ncbi:tandem-95 repeat protein [Hoeflea sp. BAL378]|uniref:beta strand repeat-containing protein n=1 Tax=Hoeflea sp. BAL378 TaxID=1547437 RepID=UPI00244DA542|nr:tandem-95 repeat protein [Hoeflea sp. BAL378]
MAFTDVDLLDIHTVLPGIVASNGALGALTANVTTDTTGTGTGGVISWSYGVAASAVEYLALNETKVETFTITLSDGRGGTVERTISVTITGTNDVPVVASDDVTGAVTEQVTPAGNLTDSGTIAFTDVDLLDIHTVLPGIVASNGALGTLTANVTTDTTGTGTGGVIGWSYRVAASAVEYLAEGETRVETFTITLSDGRGGTVERTISVTITGTNDAPVLAITQPLAVTEAADARAQDIAPVSGSLSVTDADIGDTLTASVNGSPTLVWSGGTLSPQQVIDLTAALAAGRLTLTPNTSNGGLQTLAYSWDPSASNLDFLAAGQTLTVSYAISVSDGRANSAVQPLTFTITGTNDAPVAVMDSGGMTEDDGFRIFDVRANDTLDPDAGASNAVTIGSLSFSGLPAGIDASDVAVTVTADNQIRVELLGSEWNQMFNGQTGHIFINYRLYGDNGQFSSNQLLVQVSGTNDAPVLNTVIDPAITIAEDSVLPGAGGGTLVSALVGRVGGGGLDNVTDDSFLTGIAITGQNTANGVWYYSVDNGAHWSVIGAVSDSNALTLRPEARVVFVSNANYNGVIADALTIRAWDGTGGANGSYFNTTVNGGTTGYSTATDTVSLTVTPVNDNPTITSNGGGAVAAVTVAENTTAVTTVASSDIDGGAAQYSILSTSGTDFARFTIDAVTGVLSFIAAPNFEAPADADLDNVYTIDVQVSDGLGGTDIQRIHVTVTDVPEAPTAANDSFAINEDDVRIFTIADLTGNDTNPAGGLPLTITGVSNAVNGTVSLNAGVITFTPAANFSGQASFTYTISNGAGTDTGTVTIDVAPVADAPVITVVPADPASTPEDTVVPLRSFSVELADTDGSESLVSVVLAGYPAGATFSLGHQVGATWVFDQAADIAALNAGTVTMTPPADYNGAFDLTVTATSEETVGGSTASRTVIIQMTISPVADAAVISGDVAREVLEGVGTAGDVVASGTLQVNDADGPASFIAQDIVTASGGRFVLGTDGNWTYTISNANPLVHGLGAGDSLVEHLTVTSNDGTQSQVTVTVRGVDDLPPSVTSLSLTPSVITDAIAGGADPVATLTITFSEAMDQSVAPTVTSNAASTLTNASGRWTSATTYVVSYLIADANVELGAVTFTVSGARDLAGNLQVPASAMTTTGGATIDTLAPVIGAPVIEGVSGGDTTVNISEAAGGVTVSVSITGAASVTIGGVAATLSGGNIWTASLTAVHGLNSFVITAVDAAGNISTANGGFTADLAAPAAPLLDLVSGSDSGVSDTDDITNDTTPTLTVAGEIGALVAIYDGATLVGSGTVGADGTVAITLSALAHGVHSLVAYATDQAGNTSAASGPLAVTIDTQLLAVDSFSNQVRVNQTINNRQENPGVVSLNDGGYFVYWESQQGVADSWEIVGRLYNADGTARGNEFQINDVTAIHQWTASASVLSNGNIAVAWYNWNGGGVTGIKILNPATGATVVSEFSIPGVTGVGSVSIAALDGGGFVVSAQSGSNVVAQRYTNAGVADGSLVTIATSFGGGMETDALPGGGWVTAWVDQTSSVQMKIFGANGALVATATVDAQGLTGNETSGLDVTILNNGNFIVAWGGNLTSGGNGTSEIFVQMFASDGTAIGTARQVNTTTANAQGSPQAVALGDGGYLIAWSSSGQDGNGWGTYAQRFDAAGNPVNGEFRVSDATTGNQVVGGTGRDGLALLPDGSVVAVYTDTSSGTNDIASRHFSLSGGVLATITDGDGRLVPAELAAVGFTIAGLPADLASATATFSDGTTSVQVAVTGNGSFTADLTGLTGTTITLSLSATDRAGNSGTFTGLDSSIVVHNVGPVAVADSYTTTEDTPLVVAPAQGVLANDTDGNNDPLRAVLVTNAAHGLVVLNDDGSFTYTPTANYAGLDSFTYTVNDGTLDGNTVTVSLTVAAANDAPTTPVDINPAANSVVENAPVGTVVGITVNASDVDSANITYTLVNDAGGRFAIDAVTGIVTVAGAIDYEQATSHTIRVRASDGTLGSEQDFVIAVRNVHNGLGDGGFETTNVGAPGYVYAPSNPYWIFTGAPGSGSGLQNNGSGFIAPTTTNGGRTAFIQGTSSMTQTMELDAGAYSLTFQAAGRNAYLGSNPIKVFVDNVEVGSFTPTVNVWGDVTVSFTIATAGTHTLHFAGQTSGDATTFIDRVGVFSGDRTAVLTEDAGVNGSGNLVASGTVVVNDAEPADVAFVAQTTTTAQGGTFTLGTNGAWTYSIPNGAANVQALGTGANLIDTVTAVTVDGSRIPVRIEVHGINDNPTLTGLNGVTFLENTVNAAPQIIDANVVFADVDSANLAGGTLTVSGFIAGQDTIGIRNQGAGAGNITLSGANVLYGGTVIGTFAGGSGANSLVVTFNANATPGAVDALIQNLTYANSSDTPTASRTLTITVTDGDGGTVSATSVVNVTAESDNATPVALANLYTINEDTPLSGAVTGTDGNSDPLTYALVANSVVGGTVTSFDANTGAFTFVPHANFAGTASFQFVASDGTLDSAAATISIDVAPVADAPALTVPAAGAVDPEALSGDVVVNATTAGTQRFASVAAIDGGYVVTWSSLGQDGDDFGIYAQRYASDGTPQGGETRVNTTTAGLQQYSSVAAIDGGYVVTWMSDAGSISSYNIHSQRYATDGTPLGGETQVNTVTDNSQAYSAVASIAGGYVVTWSSSGQDSSTWGIYAQRYANDGTPQGVETQVNTTTASAQTYSSVAGIAGGYVVTWSSLGQDGDSYGIYAQRYDSNGVAQGVETRVNTTTAGSQDYSAVAGIDGGYVVTWSSFDLNGSGYDIFQQRYTSDGVALGGETRVNTETASHQQHSSVVAVDGGYVVTWSSLNQDGDDFGIYAQRYTSDGVRLGGEFRINADIAGEQFTYGFFGGSQVAVMNDGTLVAVWDQDGADIEHRRFQLPAGASGNEDAAIGIPVSAVLTDTDGSETLTALTLSGVPAGATISDGTNSVVSIGAAISVLGWNLATLTFQAAANANGAFNLTLTATVTDTATLSTGAVSDVASFSREFAVTVTPVNDNPTLTGLDGVTFLENTVNAAPQIIDANVVFADVDSANLAGGTLTVSGFVAGEDTIGLNLGGVFTMAGSQVSYNGQYIGNLSGGSGANPLTISFNAFATPAVVDALIQNLTYANASNTPTASRTLTITVADGDGGTVSATSVVNVTAQSETPLAVAGNDVIDPVPNGWTWFANNGHIYKYVATDTVWSGAVTSAAGQIVGQSYLATSTSGAEDALIDSLAGGRIHLGGSDEASEGTWRWVTGPEAGQVFWIGGPGGAAQNGAFTNWSSANPGNVSGYGGAENYLATDANNNWNDIDASNSGLPAIGYMAEAGGLDGRTYAAITEDAPFTFAESWLLANDANAPAHILSVSATSTAGATVSLNAGQITYDARTSASLQLLSTGQAQTDTFTYTISDGNGGTSTATVTVNVQGVSTAPAVSNLKVTATSIGFTITASDSGGITISPSIAADALGTSFGLGQHTVTMTAATSSTSVPVNFTDGVGGSVVPFSLSRGSNISDMLNATTLPTAAVIFGFGGTDSITGTGMNDYIIGGAEADFITGGQGADRFLYGAGDTALTLTSASGNQGSISGYDIITDFDGSVDRLDFAVAPQVATVNGPIVNGTDSVIRYVNGSGNEVGAHRILSGGAIEFSDAASPFIALTLDSGQAVAAVVDYLGRNDIGAAGTLVAFTANYLGFNRTFVYQQVGETPNAANDILIELRGVTGLGNLATVIAAAMDPIVLDLNGDGLHFTGASFDLDHDGVADSIAWPSGGDGLLVADLDRSGAIEGGNEVFSLDFNGGDFATSLEALASLDSNRDARFDAHDARFGDVQLWIDANGDGVSGAGELIGLAEAGVAAIRLDAHATSYGVDGQRVFAEGVYETADGSTGDFFGLDLGPFTGTDGPAVAGGAGGAGADTFVFDASALSDALGAGGIRDLIADYSFGEDNMVDLSALLASKTASGSDAATYVHIGQGFLEVDIDGAAGAADFVRIAELPPVHGMDALRILVDDEPTSSGHPV